jgi:hypothetical protein
MESAATDVASMCRSLKERKAQRQRNAPVHGLVRIRCAIQLIKDFSCGSRWFRDDSAIPDV